MTSHRVRLDVRAVFGRLFLLSLLFIELATLGWLRRRVPPMHVIFLLLLRTPRAFFYAIMFASCLTLVLWLIVRVIVRPLVDHWHHPRSDASMGEFHLAPQELMIASVAARRASSWNWQAGTLTLTNRRLCFFPGAWDLEPWSPGHSEILEARRELAPRVAWGLIRDWPDRVLVRAQGAEPEVFAVADPDAVLSWFHPVETVQSRSPVGSES